MDDPSSDLRDDRRALRRGRHDGAHDALLRHPRADPRAGPTGPRRVLRTTAPRPTELVRALQDHGFTLQAIEGFVQPSAGRRCRGPRAATRDAHVVDLAPARAARPSRSSRRRRGARCRTTTWDPGQGRKHRADTTTATWPCPTLTSAWSCSTSTSPRPAWAWPRTPSVVTWSRWPTSSPQILHTQVLEPYRRQAASPEDAARLEQTVARLRRLTLEAVVNGFQRAANAVITRSLSGE